MKMICITDNFEYLKSIQILKLLTQSIEKHIIVCITELMNINEKKQNSKKQKI
jgi:energy-converting hydrogenase Eha subunit C